MELRIDGIFTADAVYGAGSGPWSVAIGDLDGDGDADLAVVDIWDDDVSVLLNQCPDVHNLTQGTDHLTIQEAIDSASDGDEIEVDPGTYTEAVDFQDKNITVRSNDRLDAEVVESTIIDGGGLDTVVVLSAGEISGFTITGGANTGTQAGGVHATGTAVVSYNVITGNVGDDDGGGVAATDSALVRNNRITFNEAGDVGGGVNAKGDSLVIDNYIAFNDTATDGGGLGALGDCTIRNNTIVFNSSSADAGGVIAALNAVLLNNIVAFSTDGAGIHVIASNVTADYNCVFGNFDGEYSGDAVAGPNDLNLDPLLDDDELHLTDESPCLNAGDPDLDPLDGETDIDSEARIQITRVDIGCDEVVCDGDANGDGTVDPLDSGFVLARFGCPVGTGDPSCDAADQNGAGAVDPLDSGFVLARFGPCP